MAATASPKQRLLTIGTVCGMLKEEFPDISISKIRYLEDQGLLAPRRTQGGYRLFSDEDVERLETILRLQRDEFLPLRVIRQELASPVAKERRRKRAVGLTESEDEIDLGELCERAGIDAGLARELEEYGLIAPRTDGGERRYPESDAEIALACGGLARYGIAPRHLRAFRTSADREAGLIEQVIMPWVKQRNPQARAQARTSLEDLARLGAELREAILRQSLRPYIEG